ncbi:putative disease resistance RPP13-like protein 1 [Glycine max]|nr:putative disease resistance RPP13-like protein 1 [Glycine max]
MEIDQLGTEVEYCTKSSLIVNKESRTRKLVVHISHNQAALAIFTILSSKIWSFPLRPWQQNLLVVVFDRLVSRQVLEYFRGRKLDEKLLNKLKVKLRSIDALADDAEQKQFRDPRVREWLVAVKDADIPINRMNATKKDAMFDAEDLLDEIDYEINKWDVENDSESQTCTCKESSFFETSFSSFNMKIESRMKQVLSDLEFLSSQKGDLGLKEASGLGVGSGSKVSQILPSISLVTEILETLGGALFGAVLQVLFDKLDSHQVLDYFLGRKLDGRLLKKLKRKLVSVNAVVDDAEQKQFTDAYVKAWLDDVRDVLLDTEDLLDEIDCEFSKTELEAESQTSASKVCDFESRIIDVLDDLDSLLDQKNDLGLKNVTDVGVGSGSGSKVSQKLPSTSLVVESIIYGRDDDKEIILNWLTSDTDNHNKISILSIVGMGGMGKTTLAQHVYNNPRIQEVKFDIKVWVCVSDDFDVLMLTKTILNKITKSKEDSGDDLEMVHGRLKEKLSGNKYLLVLDDVWNEDRDQWKALQTPLKYGAKGSKILVTTRSNKVASIMQSNKVHELKQLQEDHSWQVFAQHAFQDDYPKLNEQLKEIGIKIVEKCQGLPLALETVGCLLHTKPSVSQWEGVLKSKIWELPKEDSKIIPALLLSYYHLPSHLKRCFAYCALFPKDHEFYKDSLIQLWVAENFVQCSQESTPQEEIGEQYFNDLLSRSFFQRSSREKCFVMHDLLNDLAKYVCGDICFRLGVDKTKSISKVRHFSFVPEYHQYFDGYGSLYHAKRLRTFMPTLPGRDMYIWGGRKLVDELCSKFKFLRILSLFRCDLIEMPDSVGNLKHLRSLDLSKTYIKKLPDSICFLCNLQVLKLNSCDHLEELPSNLHKLTNLRCLEFMYTKVRKMPMHFGKLKNLQVLSSFYVGMGSDNCSIQQLGELNLHGRLSIEELQNIVNPLDALAADLKNKTHLLDLELKWNEHQNLDDSIKERQVLENLQPSRHLEKLSIGNYGGTQFPSWLLDNSLCNVVWLSLKNCKYCLCLPPLGLLPLLKELLIGGLDGIVSINADFYGSSSCSFTSLESLEFYDMKEWEEWECMTGAFPRLQRLYIEDCPKLKGHLPEQLCQLNDLKISGCEQLVPSALSAPDIHQLFLGDCGKLQIDHPTTLKVLTIEGYNVEAALLEQIGHNYACSNKNIPMHSCYDFLVKLEIIGGCDSLTTIHLDIFPILGVLYIRKCPNLQRISQGHAHNHLENLSIIECPQLESLPEGMHVLLPSLDSLWIIHCPKVQMFPEGGLPSNLKNMRLYGSSKLISLLKSALGDNHSLERLSIGKVDVECLPDEGVLPHSLVTLDISRCEDLKRLDYKGLCHLSSLKKLHLSNCPRLQCLPEEGLPKSISTLSIYNCPLLKQRCREPKGEDWPKIAHIKRVSLHGNDVDGRVKETPQKWYRFGPWGGGGGEVMKGKKCSHHLVHRIAPLTDHSKPPNQLQLSYVYNWLTPSLPNIDLFNYRSAISQPHDNARQSIEFKTSSEDLILQGQLHHSKHEKQKYETNTPKQSIPKAVQNGKKSRLECVLENLLHHQNQQNNNSQF